MDQGASAEAPEPMRAPHSLPVPATHGADDREWRERVLPAGWLHALGGRHPALLGYAVVSCGDVAAFGNRGGEFDECQGISWGLLLMKFATDLSAEIIREAMDTEGVCA